MTTLSKRSVSKTKRIPLAAEKRVRKKADRPQVADKADMKKVKTILLRARISESPFKGSTSEIIDYMRQGVSAEIVPIVAMRMGLSQDNLFNYLRLPKSTMKARIGKNASLSATEQDRLYRLDKVWNRAIAVFEDTDSARHWISRDNRSLGGEAPITLLDTEAGYELVLDTLGRIEYGIVA